MNALSHIKEMKPVITEVIQEDIDHKITLQVFDYSGPTSIHAVLRTITDYPLDAEGDWWHYKDRGEINLSRRMYHAAMLMTAVDVFAAMTSLYHYMATQSY